MLPDARQAFLARPCSPSSLPFSVVPLPHSLLLLFSHGFVFDSSVRFAFACRLFATFTCSVFCVAYAGCCCCRRCCRCCCCCWGRPCCCLSRVSLNLKPAQGTRKVASRAGRQEQHNLSPCTPLALHVVAWPPTGDACPEPAGSALDFARQAGHEDSLAGYM